MKCTCSLKPSNLKIIKVGNGEVGIIDLRKILTEVYLLGIEDEPVLKEELLKRVKEKNYIPKGKEELYAEALWREYRSFSEVQERFSKPNRENKRKTKESRSFLKKLFGLKNKKGGVK